MVNLQSQPVLNTLLIFTCSISKLFGVHIVMLHMQETLVCMHTIGRISVVSLKLLNMKESNALSGRQNILFRPTQMGAETSIDASTPTVGRSKSITHLITRCTLADRAILAQSLIALTFILNLTEDILLTNSSNFSLRTAVAAPEDIRHIINYINQFS